MSPESQGSDNTNQTHIRNPLFREGLHPEGVAPFREPLSDMAVIGPDGHLITGLEMDPVDIRNIDEATLGLHEVIKIDPVSRQTSVETSTAYETSKRKRNLATIVGLTLAAGVGGGGYVAYESTRDHAPKTVAVAPHKPTHTKKHHHAAPVSQPEKPAPAEVSLEGITGKPSPEQVAYAANTPILVEGGKPTATDARRAVPIMGEYYNVFRNSGQLGDADNLDTAFDLTPASIVTGENILTNLYGPEELRPAQMADTLDAISVERQKIAEAFDVYPGLESNTRYVPGPEEPVLTPTAEGELWKVPITAVSTGNWNIITEDGIRNQDTVGTAYLGTYNTRKGLAWYYAYGENTPVANDTDITDPNAS